MKFPFAVLLLLGLAACSQGPQPESGATSADSAASAVATAPAPAASAPASTGGAGTLIKYHWQLTSATDASGQRILALFANPQKPLQLDFDRRSLSISNACNRMHGDYSVSGGTITIDQFAATLKACANPALTVMAKAAAAYLHGNLSYAIDERGSRPKLTLTTSNDATLAFTGEATPETRFGGPGQTVFLEVAPETRPCKIPGAQDSDTQCLEVRRLHYGSDGVRLGRPGEWYELHEVVEGYHHQPGVRDVLRVKRYTIPDAPAGTASVAYVLDMVVQTELPQPKSK